MERYGRTSSMEGTQSDPPVEWSSQPEDTGLEEPLWQLGLSSGGGGGGGGGGGESYPEFPEEPDCIYYLRTGFCGYGARCRFNHPRDRSLMMSGPIRAAGGGMYPERVGRPVCQYYMRTGMCKFGASCKYHHPRQGGGTIGSVTFNIAGYPLRPGEKECSYYVKTGKCKFGVTCKFHHPQPFGLQGLPTSANPLPIPSQPVYPTMQAPMVTGNWPMARPTPTLLPGSYIPGGYGPVMLPSGVVSFQSFYPYQTPVSSLASSNNQSTVGGAPMYGVTNFSPGSYLSLPSAVDPSSSGQNEQALPQRPGQPECQYYMKTGECKFGFSCRYHHPSEMNIAKESVVLSSMGLPLRPGIPICSHYAQNNVCKFGPSCKFDHPMGNISYSPSASSLSDMPVAPYPIGSSSMGTLASSSSSSDMKPETLSGINKDTTVLSSRSSPSTSTSTGSTTTNLILSQSGSTAQASESSLIPSIGSEVKTSN
ncbi:zinc finger CCCH domain-containing protein 34-like [Impatiens glandulifera]|uniref:zinc finger CCCH domain-containing protein 34-like n=1 Tax=Impatiens glandulifera TaxID=253017 RepID=UPI001FB16AA4|nr:zinc finger CCCH domain-containing protein 34-like [Impatiens glandulifera]